MVSKYNIVRAAVIRLERTGCGRNCAFEEEARRNNLYALSSWSYGVVYALLLPGPIWRAASAACVCYRVCFRTSPMCNCSDEHAKLGAGHHLCDGDILLLDGHLGRFYWHFRPEIRARCIVPRLQRHALPDTAPLIPSAPYPMAHPAVFPVH